MSIASTATEFLAKEWVKVYQQRPVLTVLTTLVGIAAIAVGIVEFQAYEQKRKEKVRLENLNYREQIQQIDQMETSVAELLTFLDSQKQSMKETQDALEGLKRERDNLAPIVASDQKVIDSIFLAQEQRSESKVWRERWIGFGFGIAASLIASFLWFVGVSLLRSKRNKGEQDGADQPATAPESKPEGDSTPQSESEGRSQ